MKELLEALAIFYKHGASEKHIELCRDQTMLVHIDPSKVFSRDVKKLAELGFTVDRDGIWFEWSRR